MILLDTDVAIDVLRGKPPAVNWFDSLAINEIVAVPGFVTMELIFGARDSKELAETERWLSKCRTVWLEADSCQDARNTLSQVHLRNAIGVIDALVAQVALSLDLPLHTFNVKHFSVVPELKIICPYVR